LLGNDCEMINCTTAITEWRLQNQACSPGNNYIATGMDKSVGWRISEEWMSKRIIVSSHCELLLLWEAGSWGQGPYGNPEEGERLNTQTNLDVRNTTLGYGFHFQHRTSRTFTIEALRLIVDAPWYVSNTVIQRDLQIPTKKKSTTTALNVVLASAHIQMSK
jgi:hypothetical protein